MYTWLLLIPLFFLILFIILYKVNRTSLLPSYSLTLFLFTMTGVLTAMVYYRFEQHGNPLARWVFFVFVAIFAVIAVFGLYGLIAFLFLNARAVLKRERRSLANSLTLILGIAIVIYLVAMGFLDTTTLPAPLEIFLYWLQALVFCYFVHITQFIVASILCNLSRPKKNQDYIIVHGAGLKKDGSLTPLLAGRVDRAIGFYQEQKALFDDSRSGGKPPKLVLSGGQGPDEIMSEALAMAEYAERQGVTGKDLLLEEKSTTTLENMKFSKEVMDRDSEGKEYRAIYATSDYHLLRTGIYARWAGMKILGIGSKTAFYYIPVAMLREYAAYIVMRKRRHLIFVAISFLLACGMAVLAYFLTHIGAL